MKLPSAAPNGKIELVREKDPFLSSFHDVLGDTLRVELDLACMLLNRQKLLEGEERTDNDRQRAVADSVLEVVESVRRLDRLGINSSGREYIRRRADDLESAVHCYLASRPQARFAMAPERALDRGRSERTPAAARPMPEKGRKIFATSSAGRLRKGDLSRTTVPALRAPEPRRTTSPLEVPPPASVLIATIGDLLAQHRILYARTLDHIERSRKLTFELHTAACATLAPRLR